MAPRTRKTRRRPSTRSTIVDNGSVDPSRRTGMQTEAKSSQNKQESSAHAAVKNDSTMPGQKNQSECPPDCKCLLRGRGFFLPVGMEDAEQGAASKS